MSQMRKNGPFCNKSMTPGAILIIIDMPILDVNAKQNAKGGQNRLKLRWVPPMKRWSTFSAVQSNCLKKWKLTEFRETFYLWVTFCAKFEDNVTFLLEINFDPQFKQQKIVTMYQGRFWKSQEKVDFPLVNFLARIQNWYKIINIVDSGSSITTSPGFWVSTARIWPRNTEIASFLKFWTDFSPNALAAKPCS